MFPGGIYMDARNVGDINTIETARLCTYRSEDSYENLGRGDIVIGINAGISGVVTISLRT